jgi:hypothetical protein
VYLDLLAAGHDVSRALARIDAGAFRLVSTVATTFWAPPSTSMQ